MTPRAVYEHLGGRGDPPAVLGSRSGKLTIIAGARCVWDDIERLGPERGGDFMGVNEIGQHWQGRLDHWCTLHPEYMPGWRKFREGHHHGEGRRAETHGIRPKPEIDRYWPIVNLGGCSGLLACQVALMLGYDDIILCGMPMDNSGHYYDPPPGPRWKNYQSIHVDKAQDTVWRHAVQTYFAGRIRSMSGRTRQWLDGGVGIAA